MDKQTASEEFNHKVKVDKNHAQIFIKITPSSTMIDQAKKIIEKSGVGIIETNYLSSNWVLLKLNVRDMKDISLKLTEKGFFVHGINAV